MAAVPAPLKYGEIARIQRHFLTQIHVQVGPLVVALQCAPSASVSGQLAGPGQVARLDSWPRTAELREISEIAQSKKGSEAVIAAQLLVRIGLDAPASASK